MPHDQERLRYAVEGARRATVQPRPPRRVTERPRHPGPLDHEGERAEEQERTAEALPAPPPPRFQLPLFETPASPHPVVERLREIDPDGLRPLDALVLLAELADAARDSDGR